MRDSAGLSPDFAELLVTPNCGVPWKVGENRTSVKPDQLISCLGHVWQTGGMHLIPAERAHRRIIDSDKVCDAIGSLGDPESLRTWARRFAVLGDPTRLRLLVCINAAGPISVSDLAVAVDLKEDTVSQTLRFLRANETVVAERDGRVVRYRLDDPNVKKLIEQLNPAAV